MTIVILGIVRFESQLEINFGLILILSSCSTHFLLYLYKANKYRLPLKEIVSVTLTDMTFCGFGIFEIYKRAQCYTGVANIQNYF